jgi:hypothetical protein
MSQSRRKGLAMKSYSDRLKEMPVEPLKKLIDKQKKLIKIAERDLNLMERVLAKKAKERSTLPYCS